MSREFGPVNLKVQTIWKNITKIINETEKKAPRMKRILKPERSDVEATLKWFKQATNDTVPVSSPLLIIAGLPTLLFLLLLAQQPLPPQWAMASFLGFLDHAQRRSTAGRTPLDE